MKKIIALIMLFVLSFSIFGCSKDIYLYKNPEYKICSNYIYFNQERIKNDSLNADKMSDEKIKHLPIYKFDTLAEFQQFMDVFCVWSSEWRDKEYGEYDESFFEEKSLVLTYIVSGSGSLEYGIDSYYCDGNRFLVNAVILNSPNAFTCDMEGWFATVEVPDDMIKSCAEFDAVLKK